MTGTYSIFNLGVILARTLSSDVCHNESKPLFAGAIATMVYEQIKEQQKFWNIGTEIVESNLLDAPMLITMDILVGPRCIDLYKYNFMVKKGVFGCTVLPRPEYFDRLTKDGPLRKKSMSGSWRPLLHKTMHGLRRPLSLLIRRSWRRYLCSHRRSGTSQHISNMSGTCPCHRSKNGRHCLSKSGKHRHGKIGRHQLYRMLGVRTCRALLPAWRRIFFLMGERRCFFAVGAGRTLLR
jgi:hypothetical protein